MIVCDKCSKENQDHYKFCLGCGAELPRKDAAPRPFTSQTPPHGVPAAKMGEAAPAPAPPAPPPVAQPAMAQAHRPAAPAGGAPVPDGAGDGTNCPQCGHSNPKGNRFCASCGYNLSALAAAPIAPPAAPPVAAAAAVAVPVRLTALRADGSEAGTFDLPDAPIFTVGRDTGSVFAGDSYLSPRHATFARRGGELSVRDEGSLNGVYIKLRPNDPNRLEFDDVFRIGQEIIRFEPLRPLGPSPDGVQRFGSPAKGYIGRLSLVIGRDTTGNSFPVPERGLHCGRERGDVLFSEDGYVSGLHCSIALAEDGQVYLTDVGSSNGTFLRLRSERQLAPGDILLMGQQLFRVDY
ncbi:MAG: FHA domain-containing protein [Polyangiaceae bacterium]|nr:FHA domain-containing protein [Polyangiaceae bacterium]